MPITKKLHDVVELLGEHDVIYQDMAVKDLVRILDMAEQDIADSHLSREERHAEQQERMLAFIERRGGKAKADNFAWVGRLASSQDQSLVKRYLK